MSRYFKWVYLALFLLFLLMGIAAPCIFGAPAPLPRRVEPDRHQPLVGQWVKQFCAGTYRITLSPDGGYSTSCGYYYGTWRSRKLPNNGGWVLSLCEWRRGLVDPPWAYDIILDQELRGEVAEGHFFAGTKVRLYRE